ncbi:tuftelin interacting protein amino-terminal protein [Medicago truncatula]|uniref:Tuftelin interacting protein amino-terminal protein n=1 Tax=Medicago truncatula TaxID=3880 RepID=G7KU29_MEDTR|nr:tuftelin interacting protein amino-terminal protein [Medicago truncatula]
MNDDHAIYNALYGVFADSSCRKRRKHSHSSKKQDLTEPVNLVNFVSTGTFMPNEDKFDDNKQEQGLVDVGKFESRTQRKHSDSSKKQDLTKHVNFVSTGTFMPNEDKFDDNKQEQGLVDVGKFESRTQRKHSDSSKKQDLTKHVNFVSTGTFMPNEDKFDDNKQEQSPVDVGKFEGIKRRKHSDSLKKQDLTKPVNFVSTGIFMPNEDKYDDNKQEQGLGQEGSVDVGKFKSYNGMGMKLMEKMGYKGGGLGKNEQGILNPIEAKPRTKQSGLGFNISNETTTPLPSLETEKKSEPGKCVQPIVGRKKRCALLKRLKKQKQGEAK